MGSTLRRADRAAGPQTDNGESVRYGGLHLATTKSSGFTAAVIRGIMGHVRPRNPNLRATVIAGQRCADDYAVMWRGMSVGRIRLGNGAPHDRPQWTWSCHVHGRPQGGDDRGSAGDLVDAHA